MTKDLRANAEVDPIYDMAAIAMERVSLDVQLAEFLRGNFLADRDTG